MHYWQFKQIVGCTMKYLSYLVISLVTAFLVVTLSLSGCTSQPVSVAPTQQPTANNQVSANATVKIIDFKYVPDKLSIKVGETVKFINEDVQAHTVTASDNSFDSKNMDGKQTWTYTFKKAGAFPYICSYHAAMKGIISVINQ
jgi:plastocyanin